MPTRRPLYSNPVVVTVTRRSQKSLHTDHHMILRPYHSHHTLQKQVKRRTYIFYRRGMINRYQQTATAFIESHEKATIKRPSGKHRSHL